jgi:cytoskeletal protein RodZ
MKQPTISPPQKPVEINAKQKSTAREQKQQIETSSEEDESYYSDSETSTESETESEYESETTSYSSSYTDSSVKKPAATKQVKNSNDIEMRGIAKPPAKTSVVYDKQKNVETSITETSITETSITETDEKLSDSSDDRRKLQRINVRANRNNRSNTNYKESKGASNKFKKS